MDHGEFAIHDVLGLSNYLRVCNCCFNDLTYVILLNSIWY